MFEGGAEEHRKTGGMLESSLRLDADNVSKMAEKFCGDELESERSRGSA